MRVVDGGAAMVEIGKCLGIEEEVGAEKDKNLVFMIPWHATSVGCVAIWPMTVPETVLSH